MTWLEVARWALVGSMAVALGAMVWWPRETGEAIERLVAKFRRR